MKLDACVVSDALDRLGISGVALGIHRLSTDSKLAGPVITVRLEQAEGRRAERHLCTAAIDSAQSGDVILVEHRSRADCAGWGGILTRAAMQRGIAGAVIDGMCRDIDESRELQFPVFARGAVPVTARGRIIETAYNCAVTIADVEVHPGDWVFADGSGVVFLARDHILSILEEAEKLAAREAMLIRDVEAGVPVSQVMSRTYEHMTKKDDKS